MILCWYCAIVCIQTVCVCVCLLIIKTHLLQILFIAKMLKHQSIMKTMRCYNLSVLIKVLMFPGRMMKNHPKGQLIQTIIRPRRCQKLFFSMKDYKWHEFPYQLFYCNKIEWCAMWNWTETNSQRLNEVSKKKQKFSCRSRHRSTYEHKKCI